MEDYKTHKFLNLLDRKEIKYHYEGGWLVLGGDKNGNVNLYFSYITSLPDYIKFNNNDGDVDLYDNRLTFLPDNIEFNNGGYVNLGNNKLTSLPDGIEFNNSGIVSLSNNRLTSLPDNIKFNGGEIYLSDNPLESLPDNIDEFYDKLGNNTKEYINKEKFPDHWFFEKERFGL